MERICANYGVTPAEVHAAWSFYYDHREEIDQRLQDCRYTLREIALLHICLHFRTFGRRNV